MAEGSAPETVDPNTTTTTAAAAAAAAVNMDVEKLESGDNGGEPNQKRAREEDEPKEEEEEGEKDDVVSKKQKAEEEKEKSVEEQRLEKLEEPQEGKGEEEKKEAGEPVKLGHKSFVSSLEMFNYFFNFLNAWPHYLNINKYEHLVLLELLKKGHAEPDKKIGVGIRAFQVRKHPTFKSKCFFLIREDDSVDDFSFRKCVDHILPLPEEMHSKSEQNKAFSSGGDGGRHHGGRGGRGRGGKGRHSHGRGGRRH